MKLSLFPVGLLLLPHLLFAQALPAPVWPTPNTAFANNEPLDKFIQPTVSGEVVSGTFGCVRNDGQRVHQGIDLFPLKRDKKGEAADPIFAVYPGRVAYISNRPAYSTLGRYIVLTHTEPGLTFHTLYGHLARIDVKLGDTVTAGQTIALMGRSASDGIPVERAHLHLEMSVRLSDDFQAWFTRQKFGSPNYHGNFNGFNFSRWDPLEFFRTQQDTLQAARSRQSKISPEALAGNSAPSPRTSSLSTAPTAMPVAQYIRSLPTCVTAVIRTRVIPPFIRRNTALLSTPIPASGIQGWQIEFTPEGFPKLWTPLTTAPTSRVTLIANPQVPQLSCLRLMTSKHKTSKTLKNTLELLFTGRW